MFERIHCDSPEEHLAVTQPDRPVMYFSPSELQAQAKRFLRGFDGLVTYAVKANPACEVLENLVAAGVRGFDVASPDEIERVRAASPDAVLHYNNPVRSLGEVAAGKAAGVSSWSVDDMSELRKLGPPARVGEEIAVRFKLPVKGAHYDFGEKFGATPSEAAALLRAVRDTGYTPALSFHPGTQCAAPAAWEAYIAAAGRIADAAGVQIKRLNVGGGFAAHRDGQAPDLERIFAAISRASSDTFKTPPQLVCEPGRALVAESFALLARVKAVRACGAVFLNDGIYGALAEWRDMSASTRITALREDGAELSGPRSARKVFGPTCDSLDCLPDPALLPGTLSEGDYLLFAGMGAYSLALTTQFNGYGLRDVVTVRRL